MPWITTVTLPNPGPVISSFVQVQYAEHEYGYDIESIEIYADAACKQIIADFCVEELPLAMQSSIYSTIDNKRAQQRRDRGLRRLKADLEADADAYAARLLRGGAGMSCANVIDDHGNACGDEGRACESCEAQAMADHAYLRNVPRHAVFSDAQAVEERNQELRDAGRGHLVSL